MAKLASQVYGNALFELAVEENRIDELMEEVSAVSQILEENQDFTKVMTHPKIPKEEKLELLDGIFKGRVSDELTGFLKIVVTKERYKELPAIFAWFTARVKEYKKIGIASVVSAAPLSESWKQQIEQRLIATTSYETMEIDYAVDESLIGGAVIRIGDRVVDSSVKTKLSRLTAELMKISLESEKEGVQAS